MKILQYQYSCSSDDAFFVCSATNARPHKWRPHHSLTSKPVYSVTFIQCMLNTHTPNSRQAPIFVIDKLNSKHKHRSMSTIYYSAYIDNTLGITITITINCYRDAMLMHSRRWFSQWSTTSWNRPRWSYSCQLARMTLRRCLADCSWDRFRSEWFPPCATMSIRMCPQTVHTKCIQYCTYLRTR